MGEKPQVVIGYTASNGISYPNLRNLRFFSMMDFGKIIHESRKNDSNTFSLTNDGVYIYSNKFLEGKALRIYKDAIYDGGTCVHEEQLVDSLIKKQSKVKLTEFPTGIVTLEDRIVGQEIPYYKNALTIYQYTQINKDKIPTEKYLAILKVLKEMLDNDICYTDVHNKNFVIANNKIKAIDFEPSHVYVGDIRKYQLTTMLSNFTSMTSTINEICGISYDTRKMYQMDNIGILEEYILEEDKKIRRNIK